MALPVTPEKVFEACLVELHKSMRAASFYSLDHPALGQSLERTMRYFQNLLRITAKLEFTVTRSQILYGDKPLTGQNQVISALAGELFRRRMKKIIFLQGLQQKDLLGFLKAYRMDPDLLNEKGGMEKVLAKLGVRTIFANEVDFTRLGEGAEGAEEEDGEGDDTGKEEESVEFNLTPEQKALRDLLHSLSRADDDEFMRILRQVMDRCSELSSNGQYHEVGVAIEYLYRYVGDGKKSAPARETAEKAVRALASKEVILEQITFLAKCDEEDRARLGRLLQFVGRATVPFLLAALSTADGRTARRNLSRTIIEFGPKAVPRALELLRDDRWFVKRNVLAILGEIGSGEQLEYVLPLVHSDDPRVAKEAVKTAGRIGGESGLTAIEQSLDSITPAAQAQAAALFGARKWTAGRSKLEKLALSRRVDEEVRVACCEALGRLTITESLAPLSAIFRKKGLFKREKRLPLRRAALKALVNYGGSAKPLLLKAVVENDVEIQSIAKGALDRLSGAPTDGAVTG